MKNSHLLIVCLIGLLASCKHEHDEDAGPAGVVFEHATMKPWFDTNCGSCHATGRSNYLLWHYNSSDYSATFSAHNIEHIFEKVYKEKSMPKDKKLSDAELAKFKAWFDAGYPAK